VNVIGLKNLESFCQKHGDARPTVKSWLVDVKSASWHTPNDIKTYYPSASFIQGNHVYFNLKGSRYRLEVKISYSVKVVQVIWIGTHAEYDHRNKRRRSGREGD
jgi:mRNA interferase HigB